MKEANDDHLPAAPAGAKAAARQDASRERGGPASAIPAAAAGPNWGDRALFGAIGLLLGFSAAYVYIDKVPSSFAGAADPHAGLGLDSGVQGAQGAQAGAGMPAAAPNPAAANPATKQQAAEIDQAISASEGKYDQLVQLGNRAYDINAHALAVKAYEKALAIKSDDPNVLTDAGTSHRNIGDNAKALEYFEKAVKIDPGHWQALFNIVVVYGFDKGDTATAKKRLEELKKLKATHPEMPPLDKLEQELGRVGGGSK